MASSITVGLGIGKESSFAAEVAPTFRLPVETPNPTRPMEIIKDQMKRGISAMDFGVYPGVLRAEASLTGPVYADSTGLLLLGILGQCTTSGSGPYTHDFKLASVPPSFSIMMNDPIQKLVYLGMKESALSFKFNAGEGLLNWTGTFTGSTEATTTNTLPADNSIGTAFQGWRASVTKDTVNYCKIREMEIQLNRPVQYVYTACDTQNVAAIYHDRLEVVMTAVVDYDDYQDYEDATAGDEVALEITFDNGQTGADNKQVVFTIPKFNLQGEAPSIDRSEVAMRLNLSGLAIYDSVSATPITITLVNTTTGY